MKEEVLEKKDLEEDSEKVAGTLRMGMAGKRREREDGVGRDERGRGRAEAKEKMVDDAMATGKERASYLFLVLVTLNLYY